MGTYSKRGISCFILGLGAIASVLAQDEPSCHFEGNVQLCENSAGDYVAVSARVSSSSMTSAPPAAESLPTTVAASLPKTSAASITALVDCHMHEAVQYCMPEPTGDEIAVATQTLDNEVLPTEYTDCHSHDAETYCVTPDGKDVPVEALTAHEEHEDHEGHEDHENEESHEEHDEAQNCHFHAGIEHCTGGSSDELTCERPDRDYNTRIRIGSLFIVLVTSSIAVFSPILLQRYLKSISTTGIRFTMIKQFGTGVIICTAFVHLLTHAALQFASECLGELQYEATTMAIAMAGAFVTFLVEFFGGRIVMHRRDTKAKNSTASSIGGSDAAPVEKGPQDLEMRPPVIIGGHGHGHCVGDTEDKLSVWVMEAGIIFHSILIGITTVVAGDSGFWTLLIVIIFHQMFEGLALGSRISELSAVPTVSKFIMAAVFAVITPLGMMIGILVLKNFNGSDKATIIALGTLNALSAGILLWVGFVEMWAGDWIHGDLKRAGLLKTVCAMGSLVAGMVLMGVLGKWA